MYLIFEILEISIFGYFFYVSLYNFTLAFASIFNIQSRKVEKSFTRSICILIPAYKEDQVILKTATDVINQRYDSELFDSYVIADSLQMETLQKLDVSGVNTIKVSFDKSTKVKAVRSALSQIERQYDILVILDADNLMAPDFLSMINQDFNLGYSVIQGKRAAKNDGGSISFLDEISEQINNSIVRKGTCNLGGSSAIAGSGFAMDFNLGKKAFNDIDSVGGFDKEIELYFIAHGNKVHYNPKAVVFDEKVGSIEVFETQRKRWISSQFFYLRKYFSIGIKYLLQGNFAYFNSGVLRYAQLPRLLNLGIFSILIALLFISGLGTNINIWYWYGTFVMFILSVLLAIPKQLYSTKMLISILKLPMVFLSMFKLLFKLKGANKKFIHTPHSRN